MHRQTLAEFRSHLLERGIAPKYVRRISDELRDHLEDLRCEALASGLSEEEAALQALDRLGDRQIIAAKILRHSEFKSWIYRFPLVARIYLPIAYVLLLPATPVMSGIRNPALVVLWSAALLLGGAITALMFLFMQLSIVLT